MCWRCLPHAGASARSTTWHSHSTNAHTVSSSKAATRQHRPRRPFRPELPVTLPTHQPNPFASATKATSSHYIDVAFAVTREGTGEQIEILATSQGATRGEQRDLIRLIESTSFRPRVVDGELAAAAPVTVRYALNR